MSDNEDSDAFYQSENYNYDTDAVPISTPNDAKESVDPNSFEQGFEIFKLYFAGDSTANLANSNEVINVLPSTDKSMIAGVGSGSAGDEEKPGNKGLASQYLDSFKKFIFSSDGQKLGLTLLAGGIGNINKAKNDRKTLAISQQNADTSRLTAQNNIDNDKRRFDNASSISKTNFGTATPRGLLYKDLLTPRRQRNRGA